jgi:hypothetical protein
MRWTGHIARTEARLNASYIWNAEGIDRLEDLDVDGRVIKQSLKRQCGRAWTGFL